MHLKHVLLFGILITVFNEVSTISRIEAGTLSDSSSGLSESKENLQLSLNLEEPKGAITLSQVLSLVLTKNPELAAFNWEIRVKEASRLQAGLLPNPELEVEVEEFGGKGELSGFEEALTTIQLSQLIELGGKRSKRIRIADLEKDLARWDYETKRLDLFTETTKTYGKVLANQELFKLREELVEISEKTFNAVAQRVLAGKVSPVEETKAKIALSIDQIELEQARVDLEVSKKELAANWGSVKPSFESVSGQLEILESIPPKEQLLDLISQNPDIGRWVTELELHQTSVKLAKRNIFPDLTLSGGVQRFNGTDENAYVMGLSIPFPFFNRNQGEILKERHSQKKAEEEKRVAEVFNQTELEKVYQELSNKFKEANVLKNDVLPGAQNVFNVVSDGYINGKFGYLDVLDARRTLFEVRENYLNTLLNFHQLVADLERLIGESLTAVINTQKMNEGE